ncbi:MAG: TlpA family protein disulfide reductase [Deltaproteobacteria bacterium]|nr:TlpA family protein disulfide reductase [Deltaproteobacteria bacterium]
MLRSGLVARIAVALAGLGFAAVFGLAVREQESRRHNEPLRFLLGSTAMADFLEGRPLRTHYVGRNRRIPEFSLRDRHGRRFSPSQARGKVLVLNLWTITCRPCVEEMPTLELLAHQVVDRPDIEVRTITIDESWDSVKAIFPPRSRLSVLFDPERNVVRDKLGTRLFPETWFVDPQGIIRARVDGARDWSSPIVLEYIESLL